MNIAIIDHGAGNLVSVRNAFATIGTTPQVVSAPEDLASADAVILPGVGATGSAMERLVDTKIADALTRWEGPLLGICVGLQLLFDTSDEDGGPCLGLIQGTVERLEGQPLPHMGWNEVEHTDDPLFAGIPDAELFYFAHSYAPIPLHAGDVIGTTTHGATFAVAVRSGTRVGVQFHPERSGSAGIRLLSNFMTQANESLNAA
jgi:glutamine amidotransferase